MKTKSLPTSKPVGTKKAKSGSTKKRSLPTLSKVSTLQTFWYMDLKVSDLSNLKGISTQYHGEKWSQFVDLTRDATFEFSLRQTPLSGEKGALVIRIGPKGMAIRMPSDDKFQKIGWPKPKKNSKGAAITLLADLDNEFSSE